MSGEELLAKAKEFEKNLLNFFARQGVQHSECEDLVQETYLRLWRYREAYEPTAKLSTFLILLARQVWIDSLRHRTRRESRETSWAGEREDSSPPPEHGTRDDVQWALSRLSAPLRTVVELGVLQDLPYAEVAGILGIPVGTVKSRMSNALRKLKEVFDDE